MSTEYRTQGALVQPLTYRLHIILQTLKENTELEIGDIALGKKRLEREADQKCYHPT